MRKSGTHSSVLLARTNAREALLSAVSDSADASEALLAAAAELRAFAEPGFGSSDVTTEFLFFATVVDCCARLASWPKAVRDCETNADRYLRGAKFILNEALVSDDSPGGQPFIKAKQAVLDLLEVLKIHDVFRAVLAIPLPIAFPLESPRRLPI
jgi:hypothetical protein